MNLLKSATGQLHKKQSFSGVVSWHFPNQLQACIRALALSIGHVTPLKFYGSIECSHA